MKKVVLVNSLVLILFIGCSKNMINSKYVLADDRPNFLFVLTDDQTYRSVRALGNEEIETPNMDKLSVQGVTFSHCFNQGSWSGAVCVASRTMLITGQTVFNAAQNASYLDEWAQTKNISKITEVPLWPEVFSANGYETFITGKWHNSMYALLKGFDKGEAIGEGMYETFDENGSNKPGYGRGNAEDTSWEPWDKTFTGNWRPKVNDITYNERNEKLIGKNYIAEQHTSELYADKAINYLMNDVRNLRKPFFIYVAFNAPHDPRQSPKEFVDRYPPSLIEIPNNYLEEHPFDQGDQRIRDELLAPFPRTKDAVQLHRSEYYAMITHLDRELGRILEALEASGKADNTYVIFSSDHGLAVGQHGLMGKQNQYDHSVRMPLIIKGPNLPKSKLVSSKVYLQSMFATTCDLASIEKPETVEFNSITELIKEEVDGGEEYIFGSYKGYQRMIRSDDYKLIIYPHNNRVQLFDLVNDPFEMDNLDKSDTHREIRKQLLAQLILKQKEFGDFLVIDSLDYLN